MANEFARGGPVRDRREQERLQDIERQSPSEEMLGDSAYRYYMPAYDRLMATRPIGGTDAYRLPPVQRFADGGEADRMSAGAEIGSLFDAGNREIAAMGGLDQFGSGNYYSGEGGFGGGGGGGIFGGGSSGLGFGAEDGGGRNYSFAQAGMDIGNAFNMGNQAIAGLGPGGLEQFSDPNYYSGEGGYANPDDMLGPAPVEDVPEPGFTGVGGSIMSGAGIGPAPAFNASQPLGGLGLNFFDPTPVAQQNIDLAAAVPDRQSWDPFASGPTSQFNAPMRDNLADIAASTGITPLGSPDDYEDAPDRGFRGMQLSNVAADDPFAAFPTDDQAPAPDRDLRSGAHRVQESAIGPYTADGMRGISQQGVRDMAALAANEASPIARSIARVEGIPMSEAMPKAYGHVIETVLNRSTLGRTGFGGQIYDTSINNVMNQRSQFSGVPGTHGAGRTPGRVNELPANAQDIAATVAILNDLEDGRRTYPNALDFANATIPSVRNKEWVSDMLAQPDTVRVGYGGGSHWVGNVNDRTVGQFDINVPDMSGYMGATRPGTAPSSPGRSVVGELFGINPAMADEDIATPGSRAVDLDSIPELDPFASEKAFGRSIFEGISRGARALTGTTGDLTDPANAALPPANYDPFAAVDVRDTTPPNRGNALVDGLVRAGPGIAASWPSDAMAGRYSELGNLGNQPLTAAAYGSPGAPAMAGRNTELGGGLEPEVEVAEPDAEDPAARERAVAAVTSSGGSLNTNRYNVDPLTGRMYDNVTGDRIINPNYISRGIDFALGPTPVGPINGLLGLAGGVTGYPLSVGQLMALGRPGTPLENAGAGGMGDRNGNYGSYGEGAAGRDPPGVQSAYRDAAVPVAASPSGGGGALSTVAAALPLPVQVGRRYLGEDDDPRTYGMRAMRRYYGTV